MQSLVHTQELSEQAANWVTQSLDPYHDWQRDPAGYPDATNGTSFIQVVNLSKTITCVGPRDVHVFSMPQLTRREMYQYPVKSPTYTDSLSPVTFYGGIGPLNIVVTDLGAATMPYLDTTTGLWTPAASANMAVSAFDLSQYLVGQTRLVSMGFEVHNTTPELYKSGSVVTYQTPQTLTRSQLINGLVTGTRANVIRSVLPPATQAQALLQSGAQMWEAMDGNYNVVTMCSKENPIYDPDYADQLYQPTFTKDSGGTVQGIILYPRAADLFPNTSTNVQPIPFNTSGAYYAGLAASSTLTVTLKAYIECFPSPDQISYVSLTRPACPYDPLAIELYSRAAFRLKPGTKVENNAGGEHWAMVRNIITSIAPRLAGPLNMATSMARRIRAGKNTAEDIAKHAKQVATLTKQIKNIGGLNSKNKSETKIFGNDLGDAIENVKRLREKIRERRSRKAKPNLRARLEDK